MEKELKLNEVMALLTGTGADVAAAFSQVGRSTLEQNRCPLQACLVVRRKRSQLIQAVERAELCFPLTTHGNRSQGGSLL